MATDKQWLNNVVLPQDLQDKYEAYKAAYRVAKALRQEFEQATIAAHAGAIPAGMTLIFSYNYGKLGLALGEADTKQAKRPAAKLLGLGAWLDQQAANGHAR
jgi:hypothetical protein